MKRIFSAVLSVLLLLSALTGCKASNSGALTEGTETTEPAAGEATAQVTEIPPEDLEATVPKGGLITGEGESDIEIAATGSLRLTYSGNMSAVRYITSVEELPDHPELQGYDAAYFQDHALVIVTETVTSGTVQVGIDSIRVEDGAATVLLSHEAQGDVGTSVMTTWLLWAEVEADLGYTWSVGNPAVESEAERY